MDDLNMSDTDWKQETFEASDDLALLCDYCDSDQDVKLIRGTEFLCKKCRQRQSEDRD